MTSNHEYKLYRKIIKVFNSNYRGINLQELLLPNVVYLVYKKNEGSRYKEDAQNIRFIVNHLFRTPRFSMIEYIFSFSGLLVTNPIDRADYSELITDATKGIENFVLWKYNEFKIDALDHIFSRSKSIFHIGIVNIVASLIVFWGVKKYHDWKASFYLYLCVVYYRNCIDEFFKVVGPDIQLRKYLAFNSCWKNDNFLNACLRQFGVKTYVLQHGAKGEYPGYIPYDVIDYENINANFYLAWGTNQKKILENYASQMTDILVVGNPKYVLPQELIVNQKLKSGLVLLARESMEEGNIRLINMLKRFQEDKQIALTLKLHPNLSFIKYSKLAQENNMKIVQNHVSLKQCLSDKEFDFTISYSTTAYYESLFQGKLSFRYDWNAIERFIGLDDIFCSYEELVDRYNQFAKMDYNELKDRVNKLLIDTFVGHDGQYKEFLAC